MKIKTTIMTTTEQLHVHIVYNQIATHFDETQHARWSGVVQWLTSIPRASHIGCGNGKYLSVRKNDCTMCLLGVKVIMIMPLKLLVNGMLPLLGT